MTIREFAKSKHVQVVGKLTRHSEFDAEDTIVHNGSLFKRIMKCWVDEIGNEFYLDNRINEGYIVTHDGCVT